MKKVLCFALMALVLVTSVFANGQAESTSEVKYPTKGITLIVPWNPGGTNDLMARAMQPVFKSMYNVDLVVKNVPGGGSAVGIMEAMNSKADGYTLGLATSSFLALTAQGRVSVPVDSASNIMSIAEEPIVMVVKKNGGKYSSAMDVINAVKANPGQVSAGIPGSNNVNQAYATILQGAIGSEFNFLPFDGGSRVVAELIGGHIDCGFLKPSETIAQVKAGELAIVGVFNKDGLKIMPEVPTFKSLGYDVFTMGNIQQMCYVMGPKNLDSAIVAKIVEMFKGVALSAEYGEFCDSLGIQLNVHSGDEFTAYFNEVYKGLEEASDKIFTK